MQNPQSAFKKSCSQLGGSGPDKSNKTSVGEPTVAQMQIKLEEMQLRYKELLDSYPAMLAPAPLQQYNTMYRYSFAFLTYLKTLDLDKQYAIQIRQFGASLAACKTMDQLLDFYYTLNDFCLVCLRESKIVSKNARQTSDTEYYRFRYEIEKQGQTQTISELGLLQKKIDQLQRYLGLKVTHNSSNLDLLIQSMLKYIDTILAAMYKQ